MADTQRTLSALQTLLADNTGGQISPQDVRDFLVSSLGGYACMTVKGNSSGQTIGTSFVKVTQWDTNGPNSGVTPDATTDDDLTIAVAGDYLVNVQCSFSGSNNSIWILNVHVNDVEGALQCERTLSSSGDVGSASIQGIITLSASDTLTLYAKANGASQSFVLEHGQLTVTRLS